MIECPAEEMAPWSRALIYVLINGRKKGNVGGWGSGSDLRGGREETIPRIIVWKKKKNLFSV